jgi:hypothetical protein
MQSNGSRKWAVAVEGDENEVVGLMVVQTIAPVFCEKPDAKGRAVSYGMLCRLSSCYSLSRSVNNTGGFPINTQGQGVVAVVERLKVKNMLLSPRIGHHDLC